MHRLRKASTFRLIQSFQPGKDKIGYPINYDVAAHLKDLLNEDLSKSQHFVFDESFNKVMHCGQIDVHVRYLIDDSDD